MTSISVTKARENIYQLLADVNANGSPVTIKKKKKKNGVLIGEDDWNAIQETLYLNSVPGMTESLIEGKDTSIDECIPEDEVDW